MQERKLCAKKAAEGDIEAAEKLVMFHSVVTGDDERVKHWQRVVARLEKAARR
jgi:hypothetical protein